MSSLRNLTFSKQTLRTVYFDHGRRTTPILCSIVGSVKHKHFFLFQHDATSKEEILLKGYIKETMKTERIPLTTHADPSH